MDISDRIKLIRGKFSQEEFARALGVHKNSLGNYERGESRPNSDFVENICSQFGISPEWILCGTGPMHRGGQETGAETAIMPVGGEITMIPMVEARLSAGGGSFETSGQVERHYAFRTDFLRRKGRVDEMVLMRVDGNSMEPEIQDGDAVLLDQSQTNLRAGRIYAVGVEDVIYLKVVDTKPGKLILSSYNPAYSPIEVDMREQLEDGVRIIGRMVWLSREFF